VATTAVFAEIVAIGVLATTFLVVLVLGLFPGLEVRVAAVNDFGSLATFMAVSLAYVLGTVTDRLADTAYHSLRCSGFGKRWIVCRFGSPTRNAPPVPVSRMRLVVMAADDGKAKFLDYQRSRLRIARATVLTLVGLLPAASLLVVRRHGGFGDMVIVDLLLLAGLVAGLFAAERIGDAYVKRLCEAYWLTLGEEPPERTGARAAAVCHRGRGERLRFLLVTTKGDDSRWTFPKGRVEPGERGDDAAAREAREEAGVCGGVEEEPFTTYRFPRKKGTVEVDAYLLKVSGPLRRRPEGERRRARRWFSVQDAIITLEAGREGEASGQHAGVIREAAEKLRTGP
jgi:8-oxo-dGTP pyrophosphatase MutT (NUDIX family)